MKNAKPLSSKELMKAKKLAIFRFIFLQFALACLITLVLWFSHGYLSAYSFLLGALTSIVPSVYLAYRVFGRSGLRPAQEIVKSFYRGEAGKIVLTAILLSLVFIWVKPLVIGAFFSGFGVAILSHWLSPAVIRH